MRRGICVKCGTATVRAASNGLVLGEASGSWSHLRPHIEPDFRGAFRPHRTQVWAFGCTTCGYVELHVVDPQALAYIAEHWLPVPPAAAAAAASPPDAPPEPSGPQASGPPAPA